MILPKFSKPYIGQICGSYYQRLNFLSLLVRRL